MCLLFSIRKMLGFMGIGVPEGIGMISAVQSMTMILSVINLPQGINNSEYL